MIFPGGENVRLLMISYSWSSSLNPWKVARHFAWPGVLMMEISQFVGAARQRDRESLD